MTHTDHRFPAGARFGKLTVVGLQKHGNIVKVVCLCECGNTKLVRKWDLFHGEIESCGKHSRRFTSEKRIAAFWEKVEKTDGCWNWTGNICLGGYGQMRWGGRYQTRAHRISWMIHNGQIPDGMLICHHCDNRRCVRPEHLFLGTIADNNRDMNEKGRRVNTPQLGVEHWKARLTDSDVIEMRRLRRGGMRNSDLAAKYGIRVNYVRRICRGQAWKHIPVHDVPDSKEAQRLSRAKLNENQVRTIFNLHKSGIEAKVLAAEFNVSAGNVRCIISGKSWKHLRLLSPSEPTSFQTSLDLT